MIKYFMKKFKRPCENIYVARNKYQRNADVAHTRCYSLYCKNERKPRDTFFVAVILQIGKHVI